MLGILSFGTDILNVADSEDMGLHFWIPSDWNEFPILFSITLVLRDVGRSKLMCGEYIIYDPHFFLSFSTG